MKSIDTMVLIFVEEASVNVVIFIATVTYKSVTEELGKKFMS